MKNKIKYFWVTGLLVGAFVSAEAQTDTLTKPGRTFQDPKATDDNSKVLLDTSERTQEMVDSLLDNKKGKKHKHQPVKMPQDKTREVSGDKKMETKDEVRSKME